MASYQDIETRLRVVEDKLDFVMKQFKIQATATSPMLGPDGKPQIKVTVMDLLDVYRAAKNGSIEIVPAEASNV